MRMPRRCTCAPGYAHSWAAGACDALVLKAHAPWHLGTCSLVCAPRCAPRCILPSVGIWHSCFRWLFQFFSAYEGTLKISKCTDGKFTDISLPLLFKWFSPCLLYGVPLFHLMFNSLTSFIFFSASMSNCMSMRYFFQHLIAKQDSYSSATSTMEKIRVKLS